jgi:hypothetical protein
MIEPSWDYFFYRGENLLLLEEENQFDILQGVVQPQKSLSYFRREGAGIQELENYPNGFIMLLLTRYNIVKWSAFRNSYVISNNRERQIALSQDQIYIEQENSEINIDVRYRSSKDSQKINLATVILQERLCQIAYNIHHVLIIRCYQI